MGLHDVPSTIFQECVSPPYGGGTHSRGHRLGFCHLIKQHQSIFAFKLGILVIPFPHQSSLLRRWDIQSCDCCNSCRKRATYTTGRHEVSWYRKTSPKSYPCWVLGMILNCIEVFPNRYLYYISKIYFHAFIYHIFQKKISIRLYNIVYIDFLV